MSNDIAITDLSTIIKRGRIQAIGNDVLTPELAAKIGAALGTYLGSKGIVVMAREYSNVNRMLKRAFIGGLMSSGISVLNLHSAPVPVLQFSIRRFGANAGVYFSSVLSVSLENQIRLYDPSGIEYSPQELDSVNEYFRTNTIHRAQPLDIGSITDIPQTHEIYKKALPQFVNRKIINQKSLRIVMDSSNGPSGIIIPSILTDLKNEVIAINAFENEMKATQMLPNLGTIRDVVKIVKAANGDLGIVVDTDGSRALFIDEQGHICTFEELMMLFLKYDDSILKSHGSIVVATETAPKLLDQFVKDEFGMKLYKTQNYPGEISRVLREERAIFGGAETFKFYFPQYGPFSDATFTAIKIIEILTKKDVPLSQLLKSFPHPTHAYKAVPCDGVKIYSFKEELRKYLRTHKQADTDYQDIITGIKLVKKNQGWVMISPHLTENLIELEAESLTLQKGDELVLETEKLIQPLL